MFSKCANPDCKAPFSYRQGQLLRFQTNHSGSPAAPANTKYVRHFWLCKCCSELTCLSTTKTTVCYSSSAVPMYRPPSTSLVSSQPDRSKGESAHRNTAQVSISK